VAEQKVVQRRIVTVDYFSALRIRLLNGRLFDAHDTVGSMPAAIISEACGRQLVNGRSPIGLQVEIDGIRHEVIGVVQNVRSSGAGDDPPTLYQSIDQLPTIENVRKPAAWVLPKSYIVIRAGSVPITAEDIRGAVKQGAPGLLVADVETMNDRIAALNARPALAGSVMTLAAIAVLLLCVLGVYGAAQFNVARRRREFAIRIALGARPQHIRNLVMSFGFSGLLTGISIGALGWMWTVQLVRSVAPPVPVTSVLPLGISALTVVLLSVGAWYYPCRLAVSGEPGTILKSE
jgi:ABC-type antimicrobial peptide transport system permease subunit